MPKSLKIVAANNLFLEEMLDHVLLISRGDCRITDDLIENTVDENQQTILYGLQMLHEDLKLYKEDLRNTIEAEYQIKVLKEKNKELAQFNFIASHDLQEPLVTIQNFVGLIEKREIKKLDDIGKRHFHFIKTATTRMSNLIEGLLQYSIIGKEYSLEKINTHQIVTALVTDLTDSIPSQNLQIQVGDLPEITAHKDGIRQVFFQLLDNALKFQPKEKLLTLHISCSSNVQGHTFCIKDDGIGIDTAFHKKIFRLFYQLNDKIQYKGTGIGLAHCEKIIKMHNGRIWVESSSNNGASFFFFIPNSTENQRN